MLDTFRLWLLGLCLAALAVSQEKAIPCGDGVKCPSDQACCSRYGQCGTGTYCLGGCDPLHSNALDSCAPEPACRSEHYTFDSMNGINATTQFSGDATGANWVVEGHPMIFENNIVLTMAPDTVGTVLTATRYIWYGKVSARMRTSRGAGVITAFIFLSDVKDEIDFEFVGADLGTAQTNYYFQGITDYFNGANISTSNTFEEYHLYELEWTPEQIIWSIDGKVGRVKNKSVTWNATTNRYQFPQTPSRIQLSIWPAGLPTSKQGTIDWGGGLVNWSSEDIQTYGYYYSIIEDVTVQCYSPPEGAKIDGNNSYIYDDPSVLNNSVVLTNKTSVESGINITSSAVKPSCSAQQKLIRKDLPGVVVGVATVGGSSPSDCPNPTYGGEFIQGASANKNGAGTVVKLATERMMWHVMYIVLLTTIAGIVL